jgi:hypothetical protein
MNQVALAFAIVLGIATALLSSCGFDKSKIAAEQPQPAKVDATFASIQKNVLGPKCVGCHSEAKPSMGVDLSSYDAITSSPFSLIVPGNPQASAVYRAISAGTMPKNNPKLPDPHVKAIYNWIMAGAKQSD